MRNKALFATLQSAALSGKFPGSESNVNSNLNNGVARWGGMESLIAGRFEVLAPVRSGAMGEVVKARDHAPGEGQASDIVAVKRILCRRDGAPLSVSVGDELVQRFAREVRITEKVSSPHLPAMIAGGVDGGT